MTCLFTILMVSFDEQFLNLMKYNLSLFSFKVNAFCVPLKKSLLRSWVYFSMLCSREVLTLLEVLMFYLSHYEPHATDFYVWREVGVKVHVFFPYGYSIDPAPVTNPSFPYYTAVTPLLETRWSYTCGSVSGFSILFPLWLLNSN